MTGRIFINYRRGDDPGFTQALYQQLEIELSRDSLFLDVAGHIRPGDDFVEVLTEQVASADVVLVVIGPRWVQLLELRQGDPEDFVLIEIKAALELGKRVVPVLVGGASVPVAAALPAPIQGLARRNAVELRPGSFVADAKALCAALRAIPAAPPQPAGAEGKPHVSAPAPAAPSIRCDGASHGGFPHRFTIPVQYLRRMLGKVMFAISSDPARFYLNGIYLHPDVTAGGAVLKAVATNGHLMAVFQALSSPKLAAMPGSIVPIHAVQEIYAQTQGADGDAVVLVAPRLVRIEAAGVNYQFEPIDGVFPQYARAFPAASPIAVQFERSAVIDTVEALATVATEPGKPVPIGLRIAAGRIEITRKRDGGELSRAVGISRQSGPTGIQIGFNARYLLDILERLETDVVEVLLAEAGAPAILREMPASELTCVLMPMRL